MANTKTETPRPNSNIFDDDDFPDPIPKKNKKPEVETDKPNVEVEKKSAKRKSKVTTQLLKAGKDLGFSSRDINAPKIDGRTLRATDRQTQMNMKVKPSVKTEMLFLAHKYGYESNGHFLEELIEIFKKDKDL